MLKKFTYLLVMGLLCLSMLGCGNDNVEKATKAIKASNHNFSSGKVIANGDKTLGVIKDGSGKEYYIFFDRSGVTNAKSKFEVAQYDETIALGVAEQIGKNSKYDLNAWSQDFSKLFIADSKVRFAPSGSMERAAIPVMSFATHKAFKPFYDKLMKFYDQGEDKLLTDKKVIFTE